MNCLRRSPTQKIVEHPNDLPPESGIAPQRRDMSAGPYDPTSPAPTRALDQP